VSAFTTDQYLIPAIGCFTGRINAIDNFHIIAMILIPLLRNTTFSRSPAFKKFASSVHYVSHI